MIRKNILLIEPSYRNKYPPLGLMKLAAYHGLHGRNDHVRFVKGESPEVPDKAWDRVYVTTLFSFEWKRTAEAIDFAIRAAGGQNERVFVGGIAATLMNDQFVSEPRWSGVRFIKGLLDGSPASALQLSEIESEFGYDDTLGTPIVDLGFETGATITRNGNRRVKRRVDFNQGVDARILSKSPMFLREMSKICISPLRIAFDHIGVRKPYETAVKMAAENQILSLSNYMLYNFMDTPEDLYQRMRLNIDLNQELGVRIWSFPMRYQSVNLKDRSHIGKNWNRYQLRSFQIILQATHGVVSGNPDFFIRAYGDDQNEFLHLLSLPHAFIFHRDYYEFWDGKGIREEYEALKNG